MLIVGTYTLYSRHQKSLHSIASSKKCRWFKCGRRVNFDSLKNSWFCSCFPCLPSGYPLPASKTLPPWLIAFKIAKNGGRSVLVYKICELQGNVSCRARGILCCCCWWSCPRLTRTVLRAIERAMKRVTFLVWRSEETSKHEGTRNRVFMILQLSIYSRIQRKTANMLTC